MITHKVGFNSNIKVSYLRALANRHDRSIGFIVDSPSGDVELYTDGITFLGRRLSDDTISPNFVGLKHLSTHILGDHIEWYSL